MPGLVISKLGTDQDNTVQVGIVMRIRVLVRRLFADQVCIFRQEIESLIFSTKTGLRIQFWVKIKMPGDSKKIYDGALFGCE